ncbi:MAG: hypothetical protein KDD34_02590 [Bdellovibrionales bacterium]|nr:hypothetical protein [Bdellovibrionales bacterium]
MSKEIIRKKDSDQIVILDYVPKEFPVVITSSAENFVSSQGSVRSDFKISDLVANQVGITELQKKSLENRIEEMALERLQQVEEKAYAEAYDLGLIEGSQKAFEERRVEFENQINQINEVLLAFENIKTKLLTENESTFMKMIFEIASKIAMKEIKEDESAIIEVLKKVIEDIQSDDQITVKISSEDLMFIESYKEKTGKDFELLGRLKLESSDRVKHGGCIVETNYGSIDASIKQRVAKAWELIEMRIPKYKEGVETAPLLTDGEKNEEGDGDPETE